MKKMFLNISAFAGKCWRKFKEFCKWLMKKAEEIANFIADEENSAAIATITAVMSIALPLVKRIIKKPDYKNELEYQRRHIYDSSLGHHWTLRRELSSNQMIELARRKANGEPMSQILESMRVLL